MDAENKQRRQDVMERLRIRFTQYQKRQNEYLTRFMGNGPVKEERERQDTQLYQQRILNTRTSTKPRAKQDQGGKTSAIEQAYQSNAMGDPLILQQLKRRFDETFNQVQENEDYDDRGPSKTSRSDDEPPSDLSQYQQSNLLNNISRNMQVKCEQKDTNALSGILQKKPNDESVGHGIASLGNETSGEMLDASTTPTKDLPSSTIEATKTVTATVNQSSDTSVIPDAKTDSTTQSEKESDFKSSMQDQSNEVLQNGVSHATNEGNLADIILKDLENDFEDMLQNISDNNSSLPQTNTHSSAKTTTSQPKSKEKKENKNFNSTMNSTSTARGSEFPTSIPNMPNRRNTPPYPNGMGSMQIRTQGPSPLGIGPQIRRHLVDHIQGRGRQQSGPAPYGAVNNMPVREPLISGTQTKNPETMAKVQEHVLFKKQLQQRQMELMRQQLQQQMQQPYQQPTYQQQLMQIAQAAQHQQQHSPSPISPMMQSMSPHLQQQAFIQQNMSSPVPSPISTTPVLNRNPFQFPHDYNAYMSQQKQMQTYDGITNIQPQHDGATQIPMNYYQGPQQEPSPFPGRQAMPSQSSMPAPSMQSAAMRAMLTRDRIISPDTMPQGQMISGPVAGPSGSFPSHAPKQPPPQYSQNNFSPPSIPMERPQLQRSMSHPRNRLSHFSHPDGIQSYGVQSSVSMKSPGSLSMYPNMESSMYPIGAVASSIANGGQSSTNPSPARMSEGNFSNFQSYGPPNMNLTTALNSRTTISPTNWTQENHLQKQQTLQQMRMTMNSDYRMPMPKGPTVNLNSRSSTVGQVRKTPAQLEKQSSDITSMTPNSMMSPQRGPKILQGTSLKKETIMSDTPSQANNPSDDLESILSDPPENFDLVKLLG